MINEKVLCDMLNTVRGIRRLHVTPEFYVGFARWCDKMIADRHSERIGGGEYNYHNHLAYLPDDEIIERRLGDGFRFRGMDVRLAKEFR